MRKPENHDPIETWCSAHGIVIPPLERLTRLGLPGGALELRTNCASFESYVRKRGCYLLSNSADEPNFCGEALCFNGTGWPGVWPESSGQENEPAEFGIFRSFFREEAIEVWRPPNLVGVARENGCRHLRLLATGSDPERFPAPGPFRPKGNFGAIAHAELFDLMLCLYARVRGFTLLHGAVLEKRGAGVMLVGDSGCGKTTASLALLNGGYRLLSDEYAVMWHAGASEGLFGGVLVPQMLVGSPPETLDLLEASAGQEPQAEKTPFLVEAAKTSLQPVRLSAVLSLVAPERRAAGHEAIPLSQPEGFALLLSHLLDPVGSGRGATFEAISRVVDRVPIYQLTVGRCLRSLPTFMDQLRAAPVLIP